MKNKDNTKAVIEDRLFLYVYQVTLLLSRTRGYKSIQQFVTLEALSAVTVDNLPARQARLQVTSVVQLVMQKCGSHGENHETINLLLFINSFHSSAYGNIIIQSKNKSLSLLI